MITSFVKFAENVVSVLEGGDGDLVCCGEDMKLIQHQETAAMALNQEIELTL